MKTTDVATLPWTALSINVGNAGNAGKAGRALTLLLSIGLLCASTGCSTVAPYERAKLAHPTMAAADLAGHGESHLRAISEGAVGGSSGAGSGCGCN